MKALLLLTFAIASIAQPTPSYDVRSLPKSITSANGIVEASGRWVVTKRVNSTAPHIAQLNSINIVCRRAQKVCNESIAALYTKEDVPQITWQFLTAVISEFKITRWDNSGITAISAKRVANVELKIDLKSGTATRRHQETKERGSPTADPDLIVVWELK